MMPQRRTWYIGDQQVRARDKDEAVEAAMAIWSGVWRDWG
jgi:hypothetical protein